MRESKSLAYSPYKHAALLMLVEIGYLAILFYLETILSSQDATRDSRKAALTERKVEEYYRNYLSNTIF